MDANTEALELWMEVNTQWRAGGMGVVGLDYPAVYQEAARLGIEISNCTMAKVKALERHSLQELASNDQGNGGRAKKAVKGH